MGYPPWPRIQIQSADWRPILSQIYVALRGEPVILRVALEGMIKRPRFQAVSVDWRPVLSRISGRAFKLSQPRRSAAQVFGCVCVLGRFGRHKPSLSCGRTSAPKKDIVLHRTPSSYGRIVCPGPQLLKRWPPIRRVTLLSLNGVDSGYRVVSGAFSLKCGIDIERLSFRMC